MSASAKALAAARGLPLVPVDHLHGHVVASTLRPTRSSRPTCAWWPAAATRSSHEWTSPADYSILGQTLDDAAGEAFDKGARILGLGYPGGPEIDRLAREGDPEAFDFPRSAPGGPSAERLDFSFSGLKTSLLYRVRDLGEEETARRRADLAASYQRAIVGALGARVAGALGRERVPRLAIGGGVAANSELRDHLARALRRARRAAARAAAGALHRQRGDDRRRGAVHRAAALSGLPRPSTLRRARDAPAHPLRQAGLPPLRRRPRRGGARCARSSTCEVEEVDVSLDPRLFREYGERIPVLDVDGEEALELGFDAPALRRILGRVGT